MGKRGVEGKNNKGSVLNNLCLRYLLNIQDRLSNLENLTIRLTNMEVANISDSDTHYRSDRDKA